MSHHPTRSSAPLGVKVLAAMTALDGVISLLGGLKLLAVGLAPLAVVLFVVGLAQLLIGIGLWVLEPFAYTWGLLLFGLSAATDLLAGEVHGAGLSLVNAYVLYHYRELFRQ